MTRFVKSAALAAVLAAATFGLDAAPLHDGLPRRQAALTALSTNASAITYWVSEPDGWHVVTTVDTVIGDGANGEQHAIVRFSAVLQPGQSQLISVPGGVADRHVALRIRRLGDRVEVARVAADSSQMAPGRG